MWNETEANFLIMYDETQNYTKNKVFYMVRFYRGLMRPSEITAYSGPKGKYLNRGSRDMLCVSLAFSIHSFIKIMVFVWRICVQCLFPF